MRRTAIGLALTIALTLFPWQDACGQGSIGAHASVTNRIDTGGPGSVGYAFGVGGRLGVGVPVVGVKFLATADVIFPDCGAVTCRFYNGTVNLLYTVQVPMVATPYFGAGVAYQNTDEALSVLGDSDDFGVNLMAGISFGSLGTFHPFGELKYQFMNDHDNYIMASAGLEISTW